jgi:hypothetical protein
MGLLCIYHAYCTLLTHIYAGFAIGAFLCVDYRMLILFFPFQSYALNRTLLYTASTSITFVQIYYCGHFFS